MLLKYRAYNTLIFLEGIRVYFSCCLLQLRIYLYRNFLREKSPIFFGKTRFFLNFRTTNHINHCIDTIFIIFDHISYKISFWYWTTCENLMRFSKIKSPLYLRVSVTPHTIIAYFTLLIASRPKRSSSHIMWNIWKWLSGDIIFVLSLKWRHTWASKRSHHRQLICLFYSSLWS